MARVLTSFLLALVTFESVSGLKFLGYNPTFAHSHATFIGKIADVLVEAGHDVVLLTPVVHTGLPNVTSKHARIIHIPAVTDYGNYMRTVMTRQLWDSNTNPMATLTPWLKLATYLAQQCEATLQHPGLLEQLRAEKFDAAFVEPVDFCGFGIVNLLGIKKFAVAYSMTQLSAHRWTGAPSFPSYMPSFASSTGDRMTLMERLTNTIGVFVHKHFVGFFRTEMRKTFDKLHPEIPDVIEIIANSTYFFVNSEPLIDFPRPVTRKIVDIGGITVPDKHKTVDEHFSSLLSLRPKTVLVSFGTIVLSHMMPEAYKKNIRATARAFPDVTFIWKYEKADDNITSGIDNLVTEAWVPQTDLLHDSRLSAFVTHGGAGSITEATLAGVPLVAVPVMADQMKNAQMVKRLGTAIVVEKKQLEQPDPLIAAVKEVLEGDRYLERARYMAAMVREQPQAVRERLVSHFEFMAKYGPLEQLNHASRDMDTITFYNLDVFAIIFVTVASILSIVAYVAYLVLRTFVRIVKVQKAKVE